MLEAHTTSALSMLGQSSHMESSLQSCKSLTASLGGYWQLRSYVAYLSRMTLLMLVMPVISDVTDARVQQETMGMHENIERLLKDVHVNLASHPSR